MSGLVTTALSSDNIPVHGKFSHFHPCRHHSLWCLTPRLDLPNCSNTKSYATVDDNNQRRVQTLRPIPIPPQQCQLTHQTNQTHSQIFLYLLAGKSDGQQRMAGPFGPWTDHHGATQPPFDKWPSGATQDYGRTSSIEEQQRAPDSGVELQRNNNVDENSEREEEAWTNRRSTGRGPNGVWQLHHLPVNIVNPKKPSLFLNTHMLNMNNSQKLRFRNKNTSDESQS